MKNEITVRKIINYLTVKEREQYDKAQDDITNIMDFMKWIATAELLRVISNEELFNEVYNKTMNS